MVLKECLLIANACYKVNEKMNNNKPTGIVVHSTGANNKTLKRYVQPIPSQSYYDEVIADLGTNKYNNHWNQSKPSGRSVCVHAFIGVNAAGKVETYQTLPYDVCCWGVGAIPYDKNGKELPSSSHKDFHHWGESYNYNPQARVQFEICEDDLTDSVYFYAAMKEAQEYCAYLCKKFGFGINQICSHKESHDAGFGGNHGDPDHWLKKFNKNMDWFRTEVQKILDADTTETEKPETEKKPLYRVQTGAFSVKSNADVLAVKLKALGFDTYMVKVDNLYKVQVGAYSVKTNADSMMKKLKAAGFDAFITTQSGTAVAIENVTQPSETLKVGDKVKLSANATVYGKTAKFSSWVYKSTLYVRQINGARIVISTVKTGAVTGAVDKKYLTKV